MAAQHPQRPGERPDQETDRPSDPVPRDLPDQQSHPDDHWEPDHPASGPAEDAPDPDEAGTGPRGAPRTGTVHPEHPEPQEPSD
ncbi:MULTISPECIES: hypothetical protein [Streptomyces]|uniref:Uncharacterized protein n=1 Tax=Streptomyces misionensis TaxID=67331 RepID=A0A1H5GD95_9ACTN|nr:MULTISPECIES: hypothetical protein [Streptomyces]SEE13474.1 hypothetical protein SAMN04490357_7032 [Streptomyces misionensis]SFY48469.1 hypothetical protein STEPF1_01694 [Streptomyces sp. F-1]